MALKNWTSQTHLLKFISQQQVIWFWTHPVRFIWKNALSTLKRFTAESRLRHQIQSYLSGKPLFGRNLMKTRMKNTLWSKLRNKSKIKRKCCSKSSSRKESTTLNLIKWKSKSKKPSDNGILMLRFTKVRTWLCKTQDSFLRIMKKKTSQNTHTSNKKSTRK